MGQWAVWVWLLDSQAHVRSQPIKGSQNMSVDSVPLAPAWGRKGLPLSWGSRHRTPKHGTLTPSSVSAFSLLDEQRVLF